MVVTSNAERQLPDAFLRRCVFFTSRFLKRQNCKILRERFPSHGGQSGPSGSARANAVITDALTISKALRDPANRLTKPPGTAEIIGFVRALLEPGRESPTGRAADRCPIWPSFVRSDARVPWRKLPALHCLIKLGKISTRWTGSARSPERGVSRNPRAMSPGPLIASLSDADLRRFWRAWIARSCVWERANTSSPCAFSMRQRPGRRILQVLGDSLVSALATDRDTWQALRRLFDEEFAPRLYPCRIAGRARWRLRWS